MTKRNAKADRSLRSLGREGFTLVELMATIGLLAATSAMILPSLSLARARGRHVVSMSNQRQNGIFTERFVNDHEGRMPSFFYNPTTNENGPNHMSITPHSAEASGWGRYSTDTMTDPADEDPSQVPIEQKDGSVEKQAASYGYNTDLFQCDIRYWEIGDTANYAKVPAFHGGDMAGPSVEGPYFSAADLATRASEYRHAHGDEMTVVYTDWHVESVENLSGEYPQLCPKISSGGTTQSDNTGFSDGPGLSEDDGSSGQGNHGHGNNEDGVDSSNPGNAPFEDSDSSTDDESGSGQGAGPSQDADSGPDEDGDDHSGCGGDSDDDSNQNLPEHNGTEDQNDAPDEADESDCAEEGDTSDEPDAPDQEDTESSQGDQGEQGAHGEQGAQGEQGEQGTQGEQGAQGTDNDGNDEDDADAPD
jgi:type II secretory pathway pseudopilin PulG